MLDRSYTGLQLWPHWKNPRTMKLSMAHEALVKAINKFQAHYISFTTEPKTTIFLTEKNGYDPEFIFRFINSLTPEIYRDIQNMSPIISENLITAFNKLTANQHTIYREYLKLKDEVDHAAAIFIEAWVDFVNSDDISRIVISIGSNDSNGKQTIPEFVRTQKNSKTAILNIDKSFNENNFLALYPLFSCSYMRYRLTPSSAVFNLLRSNIDKFISNGKQVVLMSFSSPAFFDVLKPILLDQIENLGSKFCYVHGYFSFYPVIVLNKDALIPTCEVAALNPMFAKERNFTAGIIVDDIDHLTPELLLPNYRDNPQINATNGYGTPKKQ